MKLIKDSTIVLPKELWAWRLVDEHEEFWDAFDMQNVNYLFITKSTGIKILDIISADLTTNILKFQANHKVFYTMIGNLEETLEQEIDNNF